MSALLILDILIYNFTNFKSYFFLIYLPFIKKSNYLDLIISALIIDLFLFNTFPVNAVILIILFSLNKLLIKDLGFINYFNLYIFNYFIYTLTTYLVSNYQQIEILYYLKTLLESAWVNIFFCVLSYNLFVHNIKLAEGDTHERNGSRYKIKNKKQKRLFLM